MEPEKTEVTTEEAMRLLFKSLTESIGATFVFKAVNDGVETKIERASDDKDDYILTIGGEEMHRGTAKECFLHIPDTANREFADKIGKSLGMGKNAMSTKSIRKFRWKWNRKNWITFYFDVFISFFIGCLALGKIDGWTAFCIIVFVSTIRSRYED